MTLPEQLAAGLAALGLAVPAAGQAKLLDYVGLLAKWNQVHNLTAIRRQEQMISQHLLDSLAILPALEGKKSLLDVGSGGGLPGIPLAIVEPQRAVTLLDSSHKKTAFLRQAKAELGLTNVNVVCTRVEAWKPAEKFAVIVSRAFADLSEFAVLAGELLAPGGQLLAMKGVYPFEEIAGLSKNFQVSKVVALQVPELDAARHLVILNKAA